MRNRATRAILLIGVLAAVWLLWSGHSEPLILGLGVTSVLLVVLIAFRMRVVDDESTPLRLPLRMPIFLPWLLWEIARSNVRVALRILDPRLAISPRMVQIRASQKDDLGRVVYANSITLTPGTVSVDVNGDRILVHALSAEAAAGLQSGEMDRMVTWVEGRTR